MGEGGEGERYRSARHTRAGVIGNRCNRAPHARAMALARAGATGLYGDSLIDVAPNGPRVS